MTFRLELTEEQRELIAARRAMLLERREAWQNAQNALEELQGKAEELSAAIASADASLSFNDLKGIAALETKRAQLALLQRQIAAAPAQVAALAETAASVSWVRGFLEPMLRPEHERFLAEAAELLRPLYRQEYTRQRMAAESEASGAFRHFIFTRDWTGIVDPAQRIQNVLDAFHAILEGNLPTWRFAEAA